MCGRLAAGMLVCGEAFRLALCGPDYSRISAATYYSGLRTSSETAERPQLYRLKKPFNYTSAKRKSVISHSLGVSKGKRLDLMSATGEGGR